MASPQVWQQMRGSSWKSSFDLKQKFVMCINKKKSFSSFYGMWKKIGSSYGKTNSEIKQKNID